MQKQLPFAPFWPRQTHTYILKHVHTDAKTITFCTILTTSRTYIHTKACTYRCNNKYLLHHFDNVAALQFLHALGQHKISFLYAREDIKSMSRMGRNEDVYNFVFVSLFSIVHIIEYLFMYVMYVCNDVFMYVCIHVCMFLWEYVCLCVCVCVCVLFSLVYK